MNRAKEEQAIKQLSVAVSRLLECYQWDHLPIDQKRVAQELAKVKKKLAETESVLLEPETDES